MKLFFRILFIVFIFVLLTILTQVGGVVYLIARWLAFKWRGYYQLKLISCFIVIYLVATFVIIPLIAPVFGRVKISQSQHLVATSYVTTLMNRDYVTPQLEYVLVAVSDDLRESSVQVSYLDACFPFFIGFPLLPHWSHNDGRKIDLSFVYEELGGNISDLKKSRSGYGVFEEPYSNEINQNFKCKSEGYFQYDYPQYLTLGKVNNELVFSKRGTEKLIQSILKQPGVSKMFIEPHLKNRLKLMDGRVRYHGCRAVRHDDHIHIQL
jgi:hypothetical protein